MHNVLFFKASGKIRARIKSNYTEFWRQEICVWEKENGFIVFKQ